ncbi:PREDICTED: ankyrin repeat domain-containing protein 12 [Polistes canadensis]|uniref:ankyrin repeat domain-containing protein 12 n=1 Tax=Polistes canadensis TaxID=91411 RepID=UPI000718F4F1|nr:PREDICTED: ankyrin repeat domain-containing protein 12 [Polistes canadensis]
MSYEDGMPAGGNGRFRGYPARMSERQQLALLLQMTSQEMVSGGNRSENTTGPNNTNSSRSSSLQQQRGSKGRWTNKNGESSVQSSIGRKEDFRVRPVLVNGYDLNAKEASDISVANSPNDTSTTSASTNTTTTTTTTTSDSPNCSPQIENSDATSVITTVVSTTTAATTTTTTSLSSTTTITTTSSSSNEQKTEQQSSSSIYQQQHYNHHSQYQHQQQQRTTGSASVAAPHVAEDSGAPCEMRRTPPQNKVDRSGTGQSGSSPRVTLRLNQVRGARDEKKGGTSNSRQGAMNAQSQGQMESSSKMPLSGSSSITNVSGSNGSGNATSSTDNSDVYEFKSSKEPTPVRGTSSSPNPNPEKDKENGKNLSGQIGQNNSNNATTNSSSTTTTNDSNTASSTSDDTASTITSPSAKRAYDGDHTEDQDEEIKKKKRKEMENVKDGAKNTPTGRQSTGRNATNTGDKCTKSGKQNSNTVSGKNNQNTVSNIADRKSPSTASMASSPKPSNTPVGSTTNVKTATPVLPESDGEDDRSKSSDSGSAPKVPPLKIVIPQSTTSEQEQGNRNGKNTSNRSHQLPYVVPSSNSNDSTDKDQNQSASGTTSPTENGSGTKVDDKKDFTGTLHSEERSTHHQRVLRSSHRTGNGNNGSTASKEVSGSNAGNGNYSNSSPLPVPTADRSNNSSPQQRHHSPPPENTNSESNKPTSAESSNSGTVNKTSTATEKAEKNTESTGKNQKDTGAESTENNTASTSSTNSNTNASSAPVELHPRKRKMKPNKEAQQAAAVAAANEAAEANNAGPEVHPHDQPITNCFQLYLNIRKQIERRRKGLFPVQPKPPQGFKDYLMNRCTYVLAGNVNNEPNVNPPVSLQSLMKDLYIEQEKERYRLRMQHVVEKEKLVLSVEQEILRVHGRAARALANQSLPFSVCTILKDEEVYNVITPEQEEKDRNARSRYNGRLFLSWLQDVDDKWEKIKEVMLLRHHTEADSLHAIQKMDWEWKLKEVGLCEFKATPQIEDIHVPMVHVSDDFDLLPA